MPNRTRPRCPECDYAMEPIYRARPRGSTFERVHRVYWCPKDKTLAKARNKKPTIFL